jgi:hypothetical protein
MPVDLIRRMDEVLTSGRAGLDTREDFLREAAEGLLAEIIYAEAPPEPTIAAVAVDAPDLLGEILAAVPPWEQEELKVADLAGTALSRAASGVVLDAGVADYRDDPLLGIHNRDYPSIWAVNRLARYTVDGLITLTEFQMRVTRAAWFYGAQLGALEEKVGGLRLTALFPTNLNKPEAAERAFQNFAVGEVPRRSSQQGEVRVGGPLFVWRACQLERRDGDLYIGMTTSGRFLLDGLVGLSLELPHAQDAADHFLRHLFESSPGERWGFEQILSLVARAPDREELVSEIATQRSDWTYATVSSVAQGYVARAREWGLLEPRLQRGRYRLTEFGEQWRRELAADGSRSEGHREEQS